MILNKKTQYLRSISLSQEEFSAFAEGKVKRIDVHSDCGKFLKTIEINASNLRRFLKRCKLLLTQHRFSDGGNEVKPPEMQSHYYVLNLA